MKEFRVIVPYRRNGRIKEVSYPARGHALYTRQEAYEVLEKLLDQDTTGERGEGQPLEPYAEGPHERFTFQPQGEPNV